MQTDEYINKTCDWYISVLDSIIVGVYFFELVIKLIVYRWKFFKNGWNNFDFFIICMGMLEYAQYIIQSALTINPKILRVLKTFRAVRAMRSLRVLRTISFLKNLQVIVATLLNSIPAMGSIILLLFLVLYVFAIMGVYMFKDILPTKFGTIFEAVFTLFQLITLDDWFELYAEIWRVDGSPDSMHQSFWYFFIYIIVENFIFVNLFTAVIVNNLESGRYNRHQEDVSVSDKKDGATSGGKHYAGDAKARVDAVSLAQYDGDTDSANNDRVSDDRVSTWQVEAIPPTEMECLLIELEQTNLEYSNCRQKLQAMSRLKLMQKDNE
jgi:cation channel sperm-associated protein 1